MQLRQWRGPARVQERVSSTSAAVLLQTAAAAAAVVAVVVVVPLSVLLLPLSVALLPLRVPLLLLLLFLPPSLHLVLLVLNGRGDLSGSSSRRSSQPEVA